MPKACTQICRAFSIHFLEKQKLSWPASCRVAALFKANTQFTCYPQFSVCTGELSLLSVITRHQGVLFCQPFNDRTGEAILETSLQVNVKYSACFYNILT